MVSRQRPRIFSYAVNLGVQSVLSPKLVVHLALIAVRESRPVTVESVDVFFALADAGVRQTLRVVVQTTGLRTVTHSATNITHTNSHTKDDLLVVKRQPILNY